MSLEAVLEQDRAADVFDGMAAAGKKAVRGAAKGLELVVDTAVNAAYAANPLRDVKNFCTSAYHLATDGLSWKKYKQELKKGKFLGKGNLANILFTTGIVASGMYPALLGLRAGIGAASYIGKKYLTTEKNKKRISGFCDKHKKSISRLGKTFLGLPRENIEQYLSRENVLNELTKLENDKYYRQNVLPAVLDASIAAKGYAGIVGMKWLAGAASKYSGKVEQATKSKIIKKLAGFTSKTAGFARNAFSDSLSALVFASGAHNVCEIGAEKCYAIVKENVKYAADGELVKDVKNYFANSKYKDDIVATVSGSADKIAKYVKEKFGEAKQKAGEVARNPVAAIINPEEKYAVLVAGYDAECSGEFAMFGIGPKTNERFLMEQCKVYHDLLDMGFKPENIKVLIPHGLNPKNSDSQYPDGWKELKNAYADNSYSHDATEVNLEKILKGMGSKVDSNDTFVFYMTTHGNKGFEWDEKACNFKRPSYVGINNGHDTVNDYELANYVKDINGGKEIYFIDACHSGGFAKELGRGNDICVTACKQDQPAVMHTNGDSLGSYFIEELKQHGGIDCKLTYAQVKDCLKLSLDKFKRTWPRWVQEAQEQTPVVGNRDGTNHVLYCS